MQNVYVCHDQIANQKNLSEMIKYSFSHTHIKKSRFVIFFKTSKVFFFGKRSIKLIWWNRFVLCRKKSDIEMMKCNRNLKLKRNRYTCHMMSSFRLKIFGFFSMMMSIQWIQKTFRCLMVSSWKELNSLHLHYHISFAIRCFFSSSFQQSR
jgi:hypothetical protein